MTKETLVAILVPLQTVALVALALYAAASITLAEERMQAARERVENAEQVLHETLERAQITRRSVQMCNQNTIERCCR